VIQLGGKYRTAFALISLFKNKIVSLVEMRLTETHSTVRIGNICLTHFLFRMA
jgi:hypothetical protein